MKNKGGPLKKLYSPNKSHSLKKKIIAAHMDAAFGRLIFLTEYFQKLNFDENIHHGHKNTNFSAMNKEIFMKIYT